jgi:hypothetical protein
MDWIGLAKVRDRLEALVNAVMNLWVPQNAIRLSGYATGRLSGSTQLHRLSNKNEHQRQK